MAGEVRDGERIPRRPLPEFEEAASFAEALKRDGFMGTALGDKNQYGTRRYDGSVAHCGRYYRNDSPIAP
jgi:hypothetical protein